MLLYPLGSGHLVKVLLWQRDVLVKSHDVSDLKWSSGTDDGGDNDYGFYNDGDDLRRKAIPTGPSENHLVKGYAFEFPRTCADDPVFLWSWPASKSTRPSSLTDYDSWGSWCPTKPRDSGIVLSRILWHRVGAEPAARSLCWASTTSLVTKASRDVNNAFPLDVSWNTREHVCGI